MSHARQQIREAFAAAVTGLASSATVYQWRAHPVDASALPAFRVSTPSETVENEDTIGQVHSRMLTIRVEVLARGASDVDDTIDTLCMEIEEAIAADSTLSGLVHYCQLDEFEAEIDESAEQPTMQGVLTFTALYVVSDADVETLL